MKTLKFNQKKLHCCNCNMSLGYFISQQTKSPDEFMQLYCTLCAENLSMFANEVLQASHIPIIQQTNSVNCLQDNQAHSLTMNNHHAIKKYLQNEPYQIQLTKLNKKVL